MVYLPTDSHPSMY